jgi:hypothetical protein
MPKPLPEAPVALPGTLAAALAGVLLIDPTTNQVVATVPATDAPNQLAWIVLWENTLWASRLPTNDVARIDLQLE